MSGRRKSLTSGLARRRARHALRAARERLGLSLDIRDLRDFVAAIDAGRCDLVDEGLEGKRLYHVEHGGRRLGVIFHSPTRTICTLLPAGCRMFDAGRGARP